LLVTTYYAESKFIQERKKTMIPDEQLAATLPGRPIRTVEFIGGKTQQYRETHPPSAALLDAATVDIDTDKLSAALTQLRTEARDTLLPPPHTAGQHVNKRKHPLRGLNLDHSRFAASAAADRDGAQRFLGTKQAHIASQMTRLCQARCQVNPAHHTDIV